MSTNAETLERQAPKLIPEAWSLSLNKKLDNSGVGMKIVNKIFEKDIKNAGDTVNINELGDVNVSNYSESESGGGVAYQRVSTTAQQLKLDQSKYFGIFLSDITQKQSSVKELQSKFEARAKTAIDLTKDTFVLSAYADINAGNKKAVTLTKDNAYQALVWLSKTLKKNNAIQIPNDRVFKANNPGEVMPFCVINPDVEAILRQAPEFIQATDAGEKRLREGSIGTMAGLDILVCTNLPTTNNKVNIMAGINEAIAYAGNISKIEVLRDDKFFGDNVRGLYVYGKKVVLPKALAGLTADVSAADSIIDDDESSSS